MSFLSNFPRKPGTAIHAALSLIVFFVLDLIDAILYVVYEFVDEILEGESRGCYCTASPPQANVEDECYETLFRRRNIFREMWFLEFARKFKLSRKPNKQMIHESVNRWSDCSCQSCNSWTKNEDRKLHVVVKDSISREDSVLEMPENVIFIHGFMGSSYFWTETVFEHIKEHR